MGWLFCVALVALDCLITSVSRLGFLICGFDVLVPTHSGVLFVFVGLGCFVTG